MAKDMLKEIVYQQSRIITIQVLKAAGNGLLEAAERLESQSAAQAPKQAAIQGM